MSQVPTRRAFATTTLPWITLAGVVVIVVAVTVLRNGEQSDADITATPMPDPVVNDTTPSTANAIPGKRFIATTVPAPLQARTGRTEQRAALQQRVDGTHAALTAQYRNQRVDPAWSPGKERELAALSSSDQIKQLNVDIENMTVDCKASVCKISGDFDSISAGDDWLTLYMGNLGSRLPAASYKYLRNADGTLRIEIYGLGRK